ncbi:3-phosphoglycerate dehydrogenase family protein [Legionella sp. CNM-4043-24]|uniref:3-phosphoglycerate dehydrogenase family protein n=1 Tax=Legionella sp. CNM-4043-24 TaxID=3421646 RepID=UPI00403B0850
MITVNVLDNISQKGLGLFEPERYQLSADAAAPDVILVRSRVLHDHAFSDNLLAVGRAGAGTDNIPIDKLTGMGVPVFNASGANANAVKELVLAALLIGYRHLNEAMTFLNQLTKNDQQTVHREIEHQKKKFVGHEISGKTLGVIGLGHIGVKVANAALGLGMRVMAFDSNISLSNALALMPSIEKVDDMNTVLRHADIISLHVPLTTDTTHLLNETNLPLLKSEALLLNFSREKIVSEEAVLSMLSNKKMMGYITDFPTVKLASQPGVLSFPHLGASTHEAEQNSAEMVIRNIRRYLESGNIEYSVNFPNIFLPVLPSANCHRLLIINRNVPGAIGSITESLSKMGYNIEQMVNTSRDNIAVNLIDMTGKAPVPQALAAHFRDIPSFLKARLIGA